MYQNKQYDDTNRWSLFPEENKKCDNGPDYTGEVDIGGTKYRLAGWKRVSKKSGKKFLAARSSRRMGRTISRPRLSLPRPSMIRWSFSLCGRNL